MLDHRAFPALLAEIPINDHKVIRITRAGRTELDIRVWFAKSGSWRPERDGMTLPAKVIMTLGAVLQREATATDATRGRNHG